MCKDPRVLNKYVIREMVIIYTVDEVWNKLLYKKYCTLCNLRDGFNQSKIEIIKNAVFFVHHLDHICIRDYPYYNVCVYFDDILVSGET